MSMTRLSLFGIQIDPLTMAETVEQIDRWLGEAGRGCKYVVTPNVDHVVQLASNQKLKAAYAGAGLVVADGWPVVAASRLLCKPLPEVVPGSTLVPHLFRTSDRQEISIFILGAAPGVAEKAALNIQNRWAKIRVCGTYSPAFGFEADPAERVSIVERINGSGADLLLIALGAPKQELWIFENAERLQIKVALCIGATVDFLAGTKIRAPSWVRAMGLEWLHRLSHEPRRLWRRYAWDAIVFPRLFLRELRNFRREAEQE